MPLGGNVVQHQLKENQQLLSQFAKRKQKGTNLEGICCVDWFQESDSSKKFNSWIDHRYKIVTFQSQIEQVENQSLVIMKVASDVPTRKHGFERVNKCGFKIRHQSPGSERGTIRLHCWNINDVFENLDVKKLSLSRCKSITNYENLKSIHS